MGGGGVALKLISRSFVALESEYSLARSTIGRRFFAVRESLGGGEGGGRFTASTRATGARLARANNAREHLRPYGYPGQMAATHQTMRSNLTPRTSL